MAARINARASLNGGVSASATVGASAIRASASIGKNQNLNPYTGDYVFTPSEETQTIPILGKTATMDITINPSPSNYGLITWDGSVITVS